MSDYTALKSLWPSLTGETAQKITAVNAKTVPNPANPLPCVLSSTQLQSAFNATDMNGALAASPTLNVLWMYLNSGSVDMTAGGNTRATIQQIFSGCPTTLANIKALTDPFDNATVPWWTLNLSSGPLTLDDVKAAGLS